MTLITFRIQLCTIRKQTAFVVVDHIVLNKCSKCKDHLLLLLTFKVMKRHLRNILILLVVTSGCPQSPNNNALILQAPFQRFFVVGLTVILSEIIVPLIIEISSENGDFLKFCDLFLSHNQFTTPPAMCHGGRYNTAKTWSRCRVVVQVD